MLEFIQLLNQRYQDVLSQPGNKSYAEPAINNE